MRVESFQKIELIIDLFVIAVFTRSPLTYHMHFDDYSDSKTSRFHAADIFTEAKGASDFQATEAGENAYASLHIRNSNANRPKLLYVSYHIIWQSIAILQNMLPRSAY